MMWQGSGAAGGVQHVRDHNRSLILRWLTRQDGLSRSDIAQRVGLTSATISRIVRELIDIGLVYEDGSIVAAGQPGRRHIGLGIVPGAAYAAAVRLTVSEHGVSLLDLTGQRVANAELPEVLTATADDIPALVANTITRLITTAGIARSRVLGVGVVTVGAVDPARGQVKMSSIRGLSGQFIGPELASRLGLPVRLRTVGHALNMAEHVMAERRAASMPPARTVATGLLVHVAFGLGANMIIDGRPHYGDRDERLIAHMPVAGATDACVCGARGCLLTVASGHALMRRLYPPGPRSSGAPDADRLGGRLGDHEPKALRRAVEQANEGAPGVAALFYEAGRQLGLNLFAASTVLPPEQITLAGTVAQAQPYAAGMRDGLAQAWGRIGHASPALVVSTMDYARSAELFALEEFLLNVPIDVQRLMAA
jgi:predicted NBD/HSP70 family sugar kinase